MPGIALQYLRRDPPAGKGRAEVQKNNRQFLSTCRLNAIKCHINVISIRQKCVYTQKMQIEAEVHGVVGDCKQMSAKKQGKDCSLP